MEQETEKISISVAMGVYNPEDIDALYRAVESILNQTAQDFEFLIYDDCSEPQVEQELKNIAQKDARIRLLHGDSNRGLAHALNECIRHARGEYIARMDADDISALERLQVQKEFLDTNRAYDFVGSNAELFDGVGIWGEWQMAETPGKREFLRYSPYIHPSVMFRTRVLSDAGGYLESEETRRCEDYELFMRLYCKGHYGYNIQENLLAYREDREHFDKRTFRQRMAEVRIRHHGFRAMGIRGLKGLVYTVKPVVSLVIPGRVRRWIRKKLR